MEEEKIQAFMVYAGKKKDYHVYWRINKLEDNDGRPMKDVKVSEHNYKKALFKNKVIGGIFECQVTTDDRGITYNPHKVPEAYWKNSDDRAAWQLRNRGVLLSEKVKAEASKNMYQELLQPLKSAYKEADYMQRSLILAEVIRIITNC